MGKHNKISGQFAARLIEMMESPAYRVLSLSAHRVLDRERAGRADHGIRQADEGADGGPDAGRSTRGLRGSILRSSTSR